jgi:hypothetical protein
MNFRVFGRKRPDSHSLESVACSELFVKTVEKNAHFDTLGANGFFII